MDGNIKDFVESELRRFDHQQMPDIRMVKASWFHTKVMKLYLLRNQMDFKSWVAEQMLKECDLFLKELAFEAGLSSQPTLNLSLKTLPQPKPIDFMYLTPHAVGLIVSLINQILSERHEYIKNEMLEDISRRVGQHQKISPKQIKLVARLAKMVQIKDKTAINALVACGVFKKDPT